MKKFIGLILLFFIGIYIIFVTEESIRLSNDIKAKPLIVLEKSIINNATTYKSIGFKLTNRYGKAQTEEIKNIVCIGREFWLFDKILVWGWIN